MRKMIAGMAAAVCFAMGGAASADCVNCPEYDLNVSVNGVPFYGKWALVDDRPFVGIEALSDALKMPRKHYYKSWHVAEGAKEMGDPLMLMSTAEADKVKTIRFAGVTMVDLYGVAAALDMPVHHNFQTKTFQLGSDYTGSHMKGDWYRYMARKRGWMLHDDFERYNWRYKQESRDREFDDLPWRPARF